MYAKRYQMNKPRAFSAKPLAVLLSDVFSDAYAKQGFAARELVTRWTEIIGGELSAHCEPLKMQWPRPVEGQPQIIKGSADPSAGAGSGAALRAPETAQSPSSRPATTRRPSLASTA